eukprot:m.15826 g.15826  ORF g.15826 m.15826 type:complete len:140 (+) comp10818_c0_seq1:453-872(+)
MHRGKHHVVHPRGAVCVAQRVGARSMRLPHRHRLHRLDTGLDAVRQLAHHRALFLNDLTTARCIRQHNPKPKSARHTEHEDTQAPAMTKDLMSRCTVVYPAHTDGGCTVCVHVDVCRCVCVCVRKTSQTASTTAEHASL